ncbi:MAG: hypothetical protein RI894_488, partial [Bacteroidota bacterium]
YTQAFLGVVLVIAFLLVLLADKFLKTYDVHTPEVFALMLFSLAGSVAMLGFGNLAMLFLGVELLSIPMYILAGSDKRNLLSNEASLKYFLMGAFASAFLLFGIALIYGASGTFDLAELGQYVQANTTSLPAMFLAGIVLIIIAFGFKVSAAPFHFWAPDVYDGAPTIVTMFMATIVKIAAFGTFLKLFMTAFAPIAGSYSLVLAALSAMTMTIGNLSAIFQNSFKRMMAYSGVAHAGYLLLGLLVATKAASSAVLFYGLSYGVATVAAFAVLLLVFYKTDSEDTDAFKGLATKNPLLAIAATISMLSLAGIPPTAGFFGKYYLFSLTINSGYTWLAVIGILNSLISVYYYLRVVIFMYTGQPKDDKALEIPVLYSLVIGICTLLAIVFGLAPSLLMDVLG